MRLRYVVLLAVSLLVSAHTATCLQDLTAEESHDQSHVTVTDTPQPKRYSSQIRDGEFGQKTSNKKTVLDFRIESLKVSAAGQGGAPPAKPNKDDEDEKTLAQQVADGKYGLIQNELFPQGSKRPGIISYKSNPEVPADTANNLGGLDKEEIWLAEDHVLVLRGGAFPQNYNETQGHTAPIDDYVAPPRQVQIPKNPKIPPPFPVQLFENGPLQFIRGENGSYPPRPPFLPFLPPGINSTFPALPGQGPPFLPPGAPFLPPVHNLTDFDEDDPSIYYPPKYDFKYPEDKTALVPAGPLVPGIILPPPPNFFTQEQPDEQENETDEGNTPFVGPAYLPSEKRPYTPPRKQTKRPRPPTRIKTTTPSTFTSPIYVPNTPPKSHPRLPQPTTSPRPNHISIPNNKTLKQDIYIISTEPPDIANDIIDIIRDTKPNKPTSLDGISPDRHPLRSLIRPQVSVNYNGKVGHLPPSTPFPFPRTQPPTTTPAPPSGHFITFPPTISVTPVPIVSKLQMKPIEPTQNPHATFFYFEEPTEASPHENDVSASPIEQFFKSNLTPEDDYFQLNERKTTPPPVYIPSRVKPTRKPFKVQFEDSRKLNSVDADSADSLPPPQHTTTANPVTDGPFIPSNYYATANPANMHFTKFDPTIVDDITMKYFTIFGQKLNGGTTPLTPNTATTPRNHIVQAYSPRKPSTTTAAPITKATSQPYQRPQNSQFEQFLQDITGENQNDYIITHKTPVKVKKPKSRPVYNEPKIHHYYLPYQPGRFSEYIEGIYRETPSSTPSPEYYTTPRPYIQTQQPPPYRPKPLSHNLGQYLQEVVYPAAATAPAGPPRTSNLQYYPETGRQPPSLSSDVLVNYRQPLPQINPQAEILPSSYASSHSNIKVVQPPDLTQRQPVKNFYNIPQSNYFSQPQQNNAYVAYSLPDNSGHFYFLTPQGQARSDNDDDDEGGRYNRDESDTSQVPMDRLNHRRASQQHLPRRRKKSPGR